MSFLSWGDIFTLPLGGDRIMELKHYPVCGFDRANPTCYKRLFCAGRAGSGSYFSCRLFRIDPGAKSDAAKLSTPTGLAVEACSEFRNQLIEARMGVHMVARDCEFQGCFRKAVPKHVCNP